MKVRRALSDLDRAAARYTRQARREYVREAQRRLELVGHPNAPAWYADRILCGAYARTTGEPCRKPGTGAGFRCRLHGGTRKRMPASTMRDCLHDYFARHGRRGAEIRWSRVRAAGGLDSLTREFLSECGRAGGRPKKGQRR